MRNQYTINQIFSLLSMIHTSSTLSRGSSHVRKAYHSLTLVMEKRQLLDHKYKVKKESISTKVKIYTYSHHKRQVCIWHFVSFGCSGQ